MTTEDMKLLGFKFTKLEAEKNPNYSGDIEIKQNIHIESIEKYKPKLAKQDSLKVTFGFDVDYGELGKITIKGKMFLALNPKFLKEILNGWKNKNLPKEFNVIVFNIIFHKSSLKALQLEEELNLPPHVQLPRFQIGESNAKEDSDKKSK